MDKQQGTDEDAASIISGLTSMENDTDEFGRMLLQHSREISLLQSTRDEQRMNNAIGGRAQAFRKARPYPRVALTLENLERNETADFEQGARAQYRPESRGSSHDSDPPLNVPREWGRKSRRTTSWLRRTPRSEENPVHQDEDSIYPHRTAYTGDESPQVDWVGAADQGTPLSERKNKQTTTPPSRRRVDHIEDLELEQDFTAADLLASTPAPAIAFSRKTRHGNKALEEVRQQEIEREIESVERKGIATDRLDQIYQRTPSETRRRRSSARLREAMDDKMTDVLPETRRPPSLAGTMRTNTSESLRFPRRRSIRSIINNKENLPFAEDGGSTHPVFKSVETIGTVDRVPAVAPKSPQRPDHKRNDSLALLKRLARVSSNSPSPNSNKVVLEPEKARTGMDRASESPAEPLSAASTNSDYIAHGSPPKAGRRQSSSTAPEAIAGVNTLDRQSMPGTAPLTVDIPRTDELQDLDATILPAQTPIVTGAWVDTPAPIKAEVQSHQASSDLTKKPGAALPKPSANTDMYSLVPVSHASSPRRRASEPALPASALEAVLHDFRTRPKTLNGGGDDITLGESTIISLEDIVNPSSSPTLTLDLGLSDLHPASTSLHPVDPQAGAPNGNRQGQGQGSAEKEKGLTQAQKDRRQELLAIEALDKHLKVTRTSLKDSTRGLRSLEHRVDKAAAALAETASSTHTHSNQSNSHGETPAGTCPTCHRPRSVLRALVADLLSPFLIPSPHRRLGFTLTWLGLFTALFWAWLLAELVACERYGHPTYATRMVGYGVDPDAARFPFVLVGGLLGPLWGPVRGLVGAGVGVVARLVGGGGNGDAAMRGSGAGSLHLGVNGHGHGHGHGTGSVGAGSGAGHSYSGVYNAQERGWAESQGSGSFGKAKVQESKAFAPTHRVQVEAVKVAGIGSSWSERIERANIWARGQKAAAAPVQQPSSVVDQVESMWDDEFV
ncbi:hypothetical protein M8818_007915 [Zalaria obscura]|uniref:Uncharacterized protein n=1 Tax=Zalaria obscura TaxID=2024903 RepID=A0ACC3S6R6_9PEZI